LSAHRTITIPE